MDSDIVCTPIDTTMDLSEYVMYQTSVKIKGLSIRLQPEGWVGCTLKKQTRYLGTAIGQSHAIIYDDREYRVNVHLWMPYIGKIYAGVYLQLQDVDDDDCIPISVHIACTNFQVKEYVQSICSLNFGPDHIDAGFPKYIRFTDIHLPKKLKFDIWIKSN